MSIGVGGSAPKAELERLSAISVTTDPLPRSEFEHRIDEARTLMTTFEFDAIYSGLQVQATRSMTLLV